MMRLMREIAQGYIADVRFQPSAIKTLQEAAEGYIVTVMTSKLTRVLVLVLV